MLQRSAPFIIYGLQPAHNTIVEVSKMTIKVIDALLRNIRNGEQFHFIVTNHTTSQETMSSQK